MTEGCRPAPAVVCSQAVILLSWKDARLGTLANVVILVPVVAAALEARPTSYANRYRSAARQAVARNTERPLVTESDLAPLPLPVQQYLRYVGAVGRPRVRSFQAVFGGEFRVKDLG